MANIDVVIKIDEEEYKTIKAYTSFMPWAEYLIKNGTPFNEILDQIRTEIEQNAYPIVYGVNNYEKGMTLYGILQVIDKYKAEVELQENRCADCNHYDVCMSHMKVR